MAALPASGLTGYSTSDALPLSNTTGGGMPEVDNYKRGEKTEKGERKDYWPLAKVKRAYVDYLFSKRPEITEQQEHRRYRHGAHWSSEQIRIFNDRKQPVVTFNRISRKIDGICGIIEKFRAEPRAFPRHPRFQQSADLATASLRSALERAKWKRISPKCTETGAVDGIGGVEFVLHRNQDNTYEVLLEEVDTTGFFYDPRSKKEDFSDATYMGCGKWIDADVLKDTLPDKTEEIDASVGHGDELTSNSDADANTWFMGSGDRKTVRLVYICYRHQGGWCWALFTGAHILMEGKSYFIDREGNGVCSYVMFSAAVDHDGDRYGFPRGLKSAQDEVNQRRSKGLHELHTRRIIGEEGAFDDIEKARREAVRADGVVLRNKGYEAEFDDNKKNQDIVGQLKFLEDAKNEIEMFGPGSAVMGAPAIANRSGRAIALMQQAGIAELGPFVIAHQGWKQRVYEQMFYGVKKWWTNERWIRLSDDEGQQQFVQLNALQANPMTGVPQIVNSLAELDVDIVIDEGPDTATMMEDWYETLSTVIPVVAPMLKPAQAQMVIEQLFEVSPLPAEAKRKFKMVGQQPDPMAQQGQQLSMAKLQSEVVENQSQAQLNMAKAQQALTPKPEKPVQQKLELPPMVQIEKAFAEIDKSRADAESKRAKSMFEGTKARLEPMNYAQQAQQAMHDQAYDAVDLRLRKYEADAARQRSNSNASGK